ncbi:anthranilate phosphoribosyltransferase [Halobacteriales archaeon QS_1_69_70]|nr:MAG: anthranilate phosphoribosyltransferase [Halobacteriales archaeon QS_1_69_70]
MEAYIERVAAGRDLTTAEARAASTALFEFARGMRAAARTIEPDRAPLVDTCGTGGDGHDTINVSTTSAFVVSGAGVPVAKHGNYSVSSPSGSADVLEELGVAIDADPPAVERCIEERDIGFMLAPVFHPAMKAVIGPRRELGVRTIFNVLGPLTNPAGADAQVVGVYDPDLVPLVAEALSRMTLDRAIVVHGAGLDEFGVHGASTVAEVEGASVTEYTVTPADLGVETHDLAAVAGGTPAENAADVRGILDGDVGGAKRDIVLANAGAAVYVAGEADSLAAGVDAARASIDSGAARARLDALCEFDP